jgi:hypothetical protein
MKRIAKFSVLLAIFALCAGSSSAWAYRGGHYWGPRIGVGVYINPFPAYYYPGPYYYPAYYPVYTYAPPVVVAPSVQTEYIVTPSSAIPPDPNGGQINTKLYCHNPDGYYPAIQNCPAGWTKVP